MEEFHFSVYRTVNHYSSKQPLAYEPYAQELPYEAHVAPT